MANSKPMSLNRTDMNNVFKTGIIFIAPVALIYFAQVTGALQVSNHTFSFGDLVPSSFTLGAMVLYIFNRLTDIIRKFVA